MKTNIKELIEEIRNKKKTLFILCGFPYSGKTYFANEIIKETDIEYVSIDDIFNEFGYNWDLNNLPDGKAWNEIFEKSYLKVKEALKDSSNVLYDSTNHTRFSRDILRKISEEMGAEARVIFIDTPVEIVYKRWEENKLNQNRSIISKELLIDTINKFEKPDNDEFVIIIDSLV